MGTAADGVTALGNDRYGVEATLVDGPLTVGGTDPAPATRSRSTGVTASRCSAERGVSVLGNAIRQTAAATRPSSASTSPTTA